MSSFLGDDSPDPTDPEIDQLWRVVESARLVRPSELEGVDPENHAALLGVEQKDRIRLKKMYANWILRILACQLGLTNAVFIAYAWAGVSWDVPTTVMAVWLSATVVEMIGIVAIVTRHLFPMYQGGSLLTAAISPESKG